MKLVAEANVLRRCKNMSNERHCERAKCERRACGNGMEEKPNKREKKVRKDSAREKERV